MSQYELHQLMLDAYALTDGSFEFWLTATFSVIVVAHVSVERLTLKLCASITVLYLALTGSMLLRTAHVTGIIQGYKALITINPPADLRMNGYFVMFLYFVGTIGAVIYLWHSYRHRKDS